MGKTTLLKELKWIAEQEPFAAKQASPNQFQTLYLDWELYKTDLAIAEGYDQLQPEAVLNVLHRAVAIQFGEVKAYTRLMAEVQALEQKVDAQLKQPPQQGHETLKQEVLDLSAKGLAWAVRTAAATQTGPVAAALGGATVERLAKAGITFGAESLSQINRLVRQTLTAEEQEIYARPHEKLAAALGEGLAAIADKRPLVMMLDTYEVVDQTLCDYALRQVIRASGGQTVWVIAGRANLADSGKRGDTYFRGYRQDFSEQVYAYPLREFGLEELQQFFARKVPARPIDEAQAEALSQFSQGIPFVINMAAELWANDVAFEEIIAPSEDGSTGKAHYRIIRAMSDRFLMHCLGEERRADRQAIFALAMMRSPKVKLLQAMMDVEALEPRLQELRQRYSFILAEELQLDNKLKAFLGEYLLAPARRSEALVQELNGRALTWLQLRIEQATQGITDRSDWLADEDTAELLLDYAYHCFWQDDATQDQAGWRNLIPGLVEGWQYNPRWAGQLLEIAAEFEPRFSGAERKRVKRLQAGLAPQPEIEAESELLEELEKLAERGWLAGDGEAERRAILTLKWGRLLYRQEQYERALHVYKETQRQLPPGAVTLARGLSSALEDLGFQMGWEGGSSIASESAKQAFELATKLDEKNHFAWYGLGAIQYAFKKYEQAIKAYQHAITLDPKSAAPHSGLGNVYQSLKRYDHAITSYQTAIALDEKYVYPHNGLGNAYLDLKRYDDAIASYQKAIDLDDKYSTSHNGLGNVYSALKRYEDAITSYQKAIELDPKNASHYNSLGNVYLNLKRYDDAIASYQRAIEIDPENPDSHSHLGDAYRAQGEIEKSISSYQRATDFSPIEFFFISSSELSTSTVTGQELELTIHLSRTDETVIRDSQNNCLQIPRHQIIDSEVNLFLVAPGFQINSGKATSLPLDPRTANQSISQTASFSIVPLYAGIHTVVVEIYWNDKFEFQLEVTIEVADVPEASIPRKQVKASPRPFPQPDFLFQIQTNWNASSSSYLFRYQLDGYHPRWLLMEESISQSTTISAGRIQIVNTLAEEILTKNYDSSSEDFRAGIVSLGQHLFRYLFPEELQDILSRLRTGLSILMLIDQDISLPWELLHDGKQFLSERFLMSRWPWELDKIRPYEFPVGSISVGYYTNIEQPKIWIEMLEVAGAPPPIPLTGGTLADLSSTEAMRGLHLLRMGQTLEKLALQDAPVLLDSDGANQSLDQEMRPIKLNLQRNRPLASLGYLNAGKAEWTNLSATWASTFIRAGCSAFVGPLWAVQPKVEAAFVSTFYRTLWSGNSLGTAFQTARQMAQVAVPDSMDWLAYVLFGDPMARPYRPLEGQGYAIVEPVGQDIDQPVAPGATVRFRASLRRKPPIWYENRLMDVTEALEFDDLKIYVVTSELRVKPGDCIDMAKTPAGDYLGWFTLTVPAELAGRLVLVQVHFEDGVEPIHSLRFALQVADADGEVA